MILQNLNLPKGLNLHILKSIIPTEELEFLIKEMAGKSRKERRLIFPSQMCLKKCLVHFLVEKYDGDFKAVMNALKDKKDGTLAFSGIHITNIKGMYERRKKEILKENEK